jgi:hypothetical protein
MHKGAILDVHIDPCGSEFMTAARRAADSARRLPKGSDRRNDPAVTLALVGWLAI